MREIIRNTLLVGLGIAALGRKRLTNVYEKLKDEGEKFKDEIPMIKNRWRKVESISDQIDEMGQRLVKRLHIATQAELSELSKKIDKILKQKTVE